MEGITWSRIEPKRRIARDLIEPLAKNHKVLDRANKRE